MTDPMIVTMTDLMTVTMTDLMIVTMTDLMIVTMTDRIINTCLARQSQEIERRAPQNAVKRGIIREWQSVRMRKEHQHL